MHAPMHLNIAMRWLRMSELTWIRYSIARVFAELLMLGS